MSDQIDRTLPVTRVLREYLAGRALEPSVLAAAGELGASVTGEDLEQEYVAAREQLASRPGNASLRAFPVICAVALARVRVLEDELARARRVPPDGTP